MNHWGIKGRVLFLALAPAVTIAAGLTFYDIHTRLEDIEQSLKERGFAIVRQLAPASEYGVFAGNTDTLARLARGTLQEADVDSVTITDQDGKILVTEGHAQAFPPLVTTGSLKRPEVTEHPTALVFSAPILQSQTEVENYLDQQDLQARDNSKVLGHVVVELSRLPSGAKKNQITLNSLLITLTGLAISALLALRMARQVTQPIMTLAGAVATIGRGDLAVRVQTGSGGELATLERGVNNMAVALKAVQDAQEERRIILATVLDSLDALVYVADMKTYELLFLNKYAQESFGNVTGKLCWQVLQCDFDGPCPFCTNDKLLDAFGVPNEPYVWEFRNPTTNRWYLVQDSAIKWLDGRIVRLEIATDITQNKKTEDRVRRLERQIMDISEQEQERIGRELHDGLGQQLTGVAFLSKALARKLASQSIAEATEANQIVAMINQAVSQTRQLARGLQPVEEEEHGLMAALESLARGVETVFGVECEFRCPSPVEIHDNAAANHLFRIAQEAVNNAIKHGKARNIWIELRARQGRIALAVRDDGNGFQPGEFDKSTGMGLQIMHYRANMINAELDIESQPGLGTQVNASLNTVTHHVGTTPP